MFGYPLATRIMGPVHGAAFVAYAWTVIATGLGGGWSRREIARAGPGRLRAVRGASSNAGLLRRKQAAVVAGLEAQP